jgi:hypothetical protein
MCLARALTLTGMVLSVFAFSTARGQPVGPFAGGPQPDPPAARATPEPGSAASRKVRRATKKKTYRKPSAGEMRGLNPQPEPPSWIRPY